MQHLVRALAPLLVVALAGCGANGSAATSDPALSTEGGSGQQLARTNGCSGCHGSKGEGLVGPPFIGLFGSDVELDDGTTVVADRAYLVESIKEPSAKKVAGYRLPMPQNGLSDEDVDQIVAYIIDLADVGEGSS
jgi:cytochrome c oxidase subunit 2